MGDELAAKELGLDKGGVAPDAFVLRATEGADVVAEGMEGEDVRAMDLGVHTPNGVDASGVAEVVELRDEGVVLGGKFDYFSVVQQP